MALKVICDEIFGRESFVATVIWQKKTSRSNDAKWFSDNHDFILVYAKDKLAWRIKKQARGNEIPSGYANPDAEHLRALSDQVGPERSLLICCKGFSSGVKLQNLTVKKIPKAVLGKCEYGHDDYSLNVKNLPMAAPELEQGELFE